VKEQEEWSPVSARIEMQKDAMKNGGVDGLQAVYERALAKAWIDGVVAGLEHQGDRNLWLTGQKVRLGFLPKSALTLHDRLRIAGCDWFALRENPDGTWFLNPMNQDRTNFGTFTTEDLEAWILGKGPIVMTKEQRDRRAGKEPKKPKKAAKRPTGERKP